MEKDNGMRFRIIDALTEPKHYICINCDSRKILSKKETKFHEQVGHDILRYMAAKEPPQSKYVN